MKPQIVGCFSDFPPSKFESIENFYTNRKSCVFLLFFFFAKQKKWCDPVSRCAPYSRSHLCHLVILCGLSESSFFFISFPFALLFSSLWKQERKCSRISLCRLYWLKKQNGVFSFSADLCEHLLKMASSAALKTTKWVFCRSVASKFRSWFLRCLRSLSSAASQFYQPSVS